MKSLWLTKRIGAAMLVLLILATNAQAVTVKEEIDLGAKINAEVLKQTPPTNDPTLQREIQAMGDKLVPFVKRKEIPYHFAIVEEKGLNAFAVPGGYVYFTHELWDALRYDERAGVMAHEITHVDQRHSIDAMLKSQRKRTITGVLLILLGANETVTSAADMVNSLSELKYSRGDEKAADNGGFNLLRKSGMNPAGLLLSLRKITRFQKESGGEPPKVFSSHPPTQERLNNLTKLLKDNNIPVPPDTTKDVASSYNSGKVTSVNGKEVVFSSSTADTGGVVWLMRKGWDSRYENNTLVPFARGMIKQVNGKNLATVTPFGSAKASAITVGTIVYVTAPYQLSSEYAKLDSPVLVNGKARLIDQQDLFLLGRFLVFQRVWDFDTNEPTKAAVGALTVIDPDRSTGYVTALRPGYEYAPPSAGSILERISDPQSENYIDTVSAVDKNAQQITVVTKLDLNTQETYNLAYSAWDHLGDYAGRTVATVSVISGSSRKYTLRVSSYSQGYNIDKIQVGFDLYR